MQSVQSSRAIEQFMSTAPTNPTPTQKRLLEEARTKASTLLSAGYKRVEDYLRHAERDIADGRRDAAQPRERMPHDTAMQTRRDQLAAVEILQFKLAQGI